MRRDPGWRSQGWEADDIPALLERLIEQADRSSGVAPSSAPAAAEAREDAGARLPLVRPEGDEPYFVSVIEDISDRKRALEALERLERRYALATSATRDAIWEWDLVSRGMHWGEAIHTVPTQELLRRANEVGYAGKKTAFYALVAAASAVLHDDDLADAIVDRILHRGHPCGWMGRQ